MGFIKSLTPWGARMLEFLSSVVITINGTQGGGDWGAEAITCLSGSHLLSSVLITMTSLARRSRVPLVFAGFDSLQTSNAEQSLKPYIQLWRGKLR